MNIEEFLFIYDNWSKQYMNFDYKGWQKFVVEKDIYSINYKGELQEQANYLLKVGNRYFVIEGGNGFYNAPYEVKETKLKQINYRYNKA